MTHPIVERILSGQVPPNIKLAAARGALPIPREDLVQLWVLLRSDADGEVRMACKESLAEVPEEEWIATLPSQDFHPQVLDFAVRVLGKNEKILEAVLRNKNVPAEALEWMASHSSALAVDMLLDNQSRLLESPGIVVAMLQNAVLSPTQVRRLFDMSEQFFREHSVIPGLLETKFGLKVGHAGGEFTRHEEMLEEELPEGEEGIIEPEEEALQEVETPTGEATLETLPHEGIIEEKLSNEQYKSLYQQILMMTVPAKIELALKGNKEARGLLIRDSNKIVQAAVLDSPKVNDSELEGYARMRNLPEDGLRKIARNKEWMKKYNVMRALVTNPKAPPGLILPFLMRIVDMDLRLLYKDKNVSELVRREAKRVYDKRHTPKVISYKKK